MNEHKVKDLCLLKIVFISLAALLFATCSLEGDIETVRKNAGLIDTKKWITHAKDNVYHTGVGADKDGAVEFTVAQRFTPKQLETFGVIGTQLTKISFMPAESQATYSVRVWIGGSESDGVFNPGTLVYSGTELSGSNLKLEQWNEVSLTTPITIPSNQELWIGYHINTQKGYPAGADAGPHFDKFGNLIFWDGSWQTLDNTNDTEILSYNWMIRGLTECTRDRIIALAKSYGGGLPLCRW
jgi:hypothetical protein